MNITLGSSSWHNFTTPERQVDMRRPQKSSDSFTGNAYLYPRKKRRRKLKEPRSSAASCIFSDLDPDNMRKIPFTYDRFGKIRYTLEFDD